MASMSNGNTPTVPDDVSKPPEGVVLPPKDIRGQFSQSACEVMRVLTACIAIVEKTAGYVARNGAVFEGISQFLLLEYAISGLQINFSVS
jgi:splicing factor 3A subunit 1